MAIYSKITASTKVVLFYYAQIVSLKKKPMCEKYTLIM